MLFLFSCLLHISTQGHFHILGIGQFGKLVSTNFLSESDCESQSFDALSSQVCATDQVVMLHSQLPTLSASTASLTNDFKPFPLQHWNAGQQGVNFRALKWRCPSLLAVWCAHPRCSRYQVGLSTPRPPMRSPPTTPHVHLRRGFTNRGNFKLDVSPIRKHILIQSCVSLTPRIQEFSRIKAQNQSVIFKKKQSFSSGIENWPYDG